ncbi:MAG: phosphotransferase enzyme family protein [Gammaproteobacteria bacterium]
MDRRTDSFLTRMSAVPDNTDAVLHHYGVADAAVEPLGTGLINQTFLVTDSAGVRSVLQCLNSAFPATINRDIETVTAHLRSRSMPTPKLIRTQQGDLWVEIAGNVWRCMEYMPGVCVDALSSAQQADAAGALLGRFHLAVSNLTIEFSQPRLGVHNTARHLENLRKALESHQQHAYFEQASSLATRIFAQAETLPDFSSLPDRVVHGDPKISNLIFDAESGAGSCMVDLDTLAHMPIALEMGDAFRSWCNPKGEDDTQGMFSLDLFAAAVEGYASVTKVMLDAQEWRAFVPATGTIMVELAARFCADVLNDTYFGWNADKYSNRSEHNLVRAEGQLAARSALNAVADEATRVTERAFA